MNNNNKVNLFEDKIKMVKMQKTLKSCQIKLEASQNEVKALEKLYENEIIKFDSYRKEYDNKIKSIEEENEKLKSDNAEYRKQLDVCRDSKKQLDEIHKNLNRIHIEAQNKAYDLVYDAKGKVMDIFFVVEKITEQLENLKKDIRFLEKDLQIGSDTMLDRVGAFSEKITLYEKKLNAMKREFFEENNVPLD